MPLRAHRDHRYFVYIMCSQTRVLYIGITNNLVRRVFEHKSGIVPGFSKKYRTTLLVYWEDTSSVLDALARERSLKGSRGQRRSR